jgi:uncharacterized protein YjbI with pentapeptide repeats
MSAEPRRPVSHDDREGWQAYWAVQGMPWRTEPEIAEERQRYLAERRAVNPDIEKSIYPFRDENGSVRLTRADVEWLLATHASGGVRGPVVWDGDKGKRSVEPRVGLDLRGADLREADLSGLPLARTVAALTDPQARAATRQQTHLAAVRLERSSLRAAGLEAAILGWARLEDADLTDARLTGADLFAAHLEGANLTGAHLAGADLQNAYFDASTYLTRATAGTRELDGFVVADVRWGGVNLARVQWATMAMLGDGRRARQAMTAEGQAKTGRVRLGEYSAAVRAQFQLALALRGQGLNDLADRFTYRAQVLQRVVLRRQGRYGQWLFSLLLAALSGYGYRLGRILVAYACVVAAFAAAFSVGGAIAGTHLEWQQALLVSITAIHGRVFFEQFGLDNPLAWVAAVESVVGIVIEGVFVAMLIQRWFQR